MGESLRHLIGVIVLYRNDLIEDLCIQDLWHEAGADTFDLMSGRQATGEHRRGRWFHCDDFHPWILVLQHLTHTSDRAPRPDPSDKAMDRITAHGSQDLFRSSAPMDLGVRRVVELLRHEI